MDSDYCSKASTLLAALLTYMCFNVLTCPVAGRVQNGGLPGPGEVDTVCTAPFQPFSDCLLNDTIGAEPIGKVFVDPLELLQSAFCNLDKTSRPDCTIDKGVWQVGLGLSNPCVLLDGILACSDLAAGTKGSSYTRECGLG